MSNAIALQRKFEQDIEQAKKRNLTRRRKYPAALRGELRHTPQGRKRERDAMRSAMCAICRRRVEGRELHLDHCHTTGRTRGFLCNQCNAGIGMFRDNQKLLDSAIKYLRYYSLLNYEG